MRTYGPALAGACAALVVIARAPSARAGDNIEVVTGGGSVISHKLWDPVAMPLGWRLHEDGVVNNDSAGYGTPPVTNAEAEAELSLAFQAWEGVASSELSVTYEAETPEADSGCDFLNIVTWSDSNTTWSPGVIAKGLTTSYVGPDLVLDAVNRNTIACAGGTVALDTATYPNGMTLRSGTILDMDMTWNATEFDYVTTPNATPNVLDLRAVATHEFGHMFGFSHTSLAYAASDPATMFPIVSATDVALQNNMRTLELDDVASSGGYPGLGFWPGGVAPYATGAVSGRVLQAGGSAASGVRIWAFDVTDTSQPVYEAFSATDFDWDPALQAGDYVMGGMQPGVYYLCIVPWSNGVPTAQSAMPGRYNLTTINGSGNTGFPTECYDDAPSATASPDFSTGLDRLRKVTVTAGSTTANINFVTGTQATDFVLVMDRSGSMTLDSGTPGVTKIEALQNAANGFIDYLDLSGGHRLGLVQFQEMLVPLSPVFNLQALNAASAVTAHDAINNMSAGGWTNIIAGVNEGIGQLATVGSPHERQIMLLFSDGQHNRPIGSDLNDIDAPLLSNDIRFYSIGFGTDVDDAILSKVALDTGGVHVNEQDLDALSLGKHFLSIAASAADDTTLIDPRYRLGPGQSAALSVPVGASERNLTFAVQWATRNPSRFDVRAKSPSGCAVSGFLSTPGATVKRGDTHRLVKIDLPYECSGRLDGAGNWTIEVTGGRTIEKQDEVDVIVFGSSRTQLYAGTSTFGKEPILIAKVLHEGMPLKRARVRAEIVLPLPPTFDSEKQDRQERGAYVPPYPPREKRKVTLELSDDGYDRDAAARDGIFSARLPLEKPGLYSVRVIAQYEDEKALVGRELLTSYSFDGKTVLSAPKVQPPKIRVGH